MRPNRVRRRRIRVRRVEILRPGRGEEIFPDGPSFGHTNGAQNPSTDVRTDTTRIRAGDIFLGVVPSRHGVSHAHFRVLQIRFSKSHAQIRVKASASATPIVAWIDYEDLVSALRMGLAWHVSEAPFEI